MSKRDNNPRQLHEGYFTAHVVLYPKFSTFVAFYTHSIDKLYREVSEGKETADILAVPLLFLMRHTLELGYKYSLTYLCKENSTMFEPEKRGEEGHSLVLLHNRLGKEYAQASKLGVVLDEDHGFDELYAETEKGMRFFDDLDERSTKLRFPKIDETSSFTNQKTVNLLKAKNTFDAAMVLLTSLADVIVEGKYNNG
jgi:hypothetical protein